MTQKASALNGGADQPEKKHSRDHINNKTPKFDEPNGEQKNVSSKQKASTGVLRDSNRAQKGVSSEQKDSNRGLRGTPSCFI